jgi:hypothetical protein
MRTWLLDTKILMTLAIRRSGDLSQGIVVALQHTCAVWTGER